MGKVHTLLRTVLFLVLVGFSVSLLSACGKDDDPTEPQATRLRVLNSSVNAIRDVHFSLCTDTDWGPDRLAANETINPGAEKIWDTNAGCWDVLLITTT